MNITFTFRQMEATDSMRGYATEKLSKLQKFLRGPMKSQVTLSSQRTQHSAEIDLHSGSDHFHAHESSEDMYASIDRVVDKLERQITGAHAAQVGKKKGAERASSRLLPDVPDEEY